MGKNYKNYVLAILSGVILALSYPGWSFDLGFLAFVGLIPLFFALARTKSHFRTGYLAGLAYFAITFRWFWATHPLTALGIENRFVSILALLGVYGPVVILIAIFWGFSGLLFSKIRSTKLIFFIIPAIFVLTEYARSFGFGVAMAGPGTLYGPHWTMGNIAYGLSDNLFFLKLSSFIGIYGILFMIVLVNYVFYLFIAKRNFKFSFGDRASVTVAVIFASIFFSYLYRPSDPGYVPIKISYAIIQTDERAGVNRTATDSLAGLKQQLAFLNQVSKEFPKTQLVVFPEASDLLSKLSVFLSDDGVVSYFNNLFPDSRLIVSGSRIMDSDSLPKSRVFSIDTKNGAVGYYDKRLLTPGGEFLPYPVRFVADMFSKETADQYGSFREFGIGLKESSFVNFNGRFSVAPLICSELLSPNLARKTIGKTDIIIGMSSTAIYHDSIQPIKELLAINRFRAAENKRPLIFSSNSGLSYVIDGNGVVKKIASRKGPQLLTGDIDIKRGKSWYNNYGDWPVLVVSLLGLALIIIPTKKYVHEA